MPKINPLIIAGSVGLVAWLASRLGRASTLDDAPEATPPAPPSTQGAESQGLQDRGGQVERPTLQALGRFFGGGFRRTPTPVLAQSGPAGYIPSESLAGVPALSQVYEPGHFGLVFGSMSGHGTMGGPSASPMIASIPATWSAGRVTPFGSYSGVATASGNAIRTRRGRGDARHVVSAGTNGGVLLSTQSVNKYRDARSINTSSGRKNASGWTAFQRGSPGVGVAPQFAGYSLIPAGFQAAWLDQFETFEVPDTEIGTEQLRAREANGQVSSRYATWARNNVSRREGFYHDGEFFVRTDGPYGSTNWAGISDADSRIKYFISENGFVALDTRTMTNAYNAVRGDGAAFWQNLSPRWKDLPYGAVPMAENPWQAAPFVTASSAITGRASTQRNWFWSPNHPIAHHTQQPGFDLDQWARMAGNVDDSRLRSSYPADSAFSGIGRKLYKRRGDARGLTGCMNNRCHLTCIDPKRGIINPGYGVVQGRGRAPFDFAAPTILEAFVRTKMQFYRTDIRFAGDL